MNIIGHWLTIKCFKHDGQPHRIWDRGLVLENTDDDISKANGLIDFYNQDKEKQFFVATFYIKFNSC